MLLIQLTASHGPQECERAAQSTLNALLREAQAAGIAFEVLNCVDTGAGCKSALLRSDSDGAGDVRLASTQLYLGGDARMVSAILG